jgi:hypothetical protein
LVFRWHLVSFPKAKAAQHPGWGVAAGGTGLVVGLTVLARALTR